MSAVAVARMPDGLRNVHGRGMNTRSDVRNLYSDLILRLEFATAKTRT